MALEEETGSLSGAVPEGASVSGRVKTLCWARVNVACSGDAPVPVRPPAGRGCRPHPPKPQRRGAESAPSVLVASVRRRPRGSVGFNPEGREQGRAAPLPAAMPFAPSAPVAVAWLSCELCPRGAPVCDRGPAVTLGQTSLMWSLLLNPGLGPPRERPRPAPCSPLSPGQSPSGRPHWSLARGPQGGAGRRSEPSGPVVATPRS